MIFVFVLLYLLDVVCLLLLIILIRIEDIGDILVGVCVKNRLNYTEGDMLKIIDFIVDIPFVYDFYDKIIVFGFVWRYYLLRKLFFWKFFNG